MENKKVNLSFYLVVIFFVALSIILIRDYNAKRAIDYREYSVTIARIVNLKNDRIRILYNLLVAKDNLLAEKEKENGDLKNTLAETRNDLDAISRKLAQPASVAVPAGTPAAATAAK